MRERLSRRAFSATAITGAVVAGMPERFLAAQDATPPAGAGIESALGQLPALIADMQARSGVPGIAIAVVHNDEVVYAEGFGEREIGTGTSVGADTVFQIASVSKPVSSTVIAAVVGDGELTWDTKMVDLLPDFRLSDPWITANVTLADLFSHRSGLPEHVGDELEDLGGTRDQVLESLRFVDLVGEFRASYAYTNFGLTAAAEAVARSMGKTWEDLADEVLFAPAGMTQTSFRHSDLVARPDRALGHVRKDGAWVQAFDRQPDPEAPAGGVSSSVRDLAQWMRLQLRNGELDGMALIDAAALGTTHLPHAMSRMPAPPFDRLPGFYGLGWNVGYDETHTVELNHSGAFLYGAATAVFLWPGEDLGIVVLTNGEPVGLPESICLAFRDLYRTGDVAVDYLSEIGSFMATALAPKYGADVVDAPANPEPARDLTSYAGSYHSYVYGELDITANGDGLVMTLGPMQTEFPLTHFNRDVFTYDPIGESATGTSAVTFTFAADRLPLQVVVENLDLYNAGTFERM